MGIQINGNTNNINAGIGSLSIEDLNELDIVGVATASNFKTGSSNLHSTGLTIGNTLVHSTGINVGTGATVHSPASNVLTLGTNSNERLRITSDGKIGINQDTPRALLSLGGTVDAQKMLIYDNDGATNEKYGFGIQSNELRQFAGGSAILSFGHISSSDGSTYNERLRINNSGAIGLGGANYGSSGQVLTSAGSGSAVTWSTISGTTINNNANNRVITGSGTANTLEGEANLTFTGSILTVTNSSGASELTLVTPSANDSGVYFNDGSNAGALTYVHSDNSMRFRVNSTEKLRILSTGDVGIGITNPTKTGIQNLVKVLQIDGGDGAELILGNSQSPNVSTNHIGAIAFKNIDTSLGTAPHYAGIRCNATDTVGNMNLKFYAGSTAFESDSAHMSIISSGAVTKPYQVGFYATANSGGTVTMTSTHTLNNWRLSTSGKTYSIGGHFNTSNGRFTAPITGQYLFTGSILLQNYDTASGIHMMWRKNGSTYQYWYNTRTSDIDRSGYGGFLAQGSTTTFSLTTNDYIEVACNFSGTLKLWCGDANWGHFSGYFLG